MQQGSAESLFSTTGVNTFLIRLVNNNQTEKTAKVLSQVFASHHIVIVGVLIGYNSQITDTVDGVLGIMRVLSLLALLLSVFLVLGTITKLVAEQFKIIGVMKAIGAVRGQVIRHYLALVVIYGLVGTLLGLILGIIGGSYLVNYMGSLLNLDIGSLQVPTWLILESILVGVGTPVIAATLLVYIGTRITVQQALSDYGLEGGQSEKGTTWARLSRTLFSFFPQTVQLGIRGLFRRRWRAILTLSTLAIAGVAFLAVQTTSYSFTTFLSSVFATYHFDVVVSVPSPQPYDKLQGIIAQVPGVAQTENLSWSYVNTNWGTALLTGVQLDTKLYQRHLLAGRWFTTNEQNVAIISKDAADKSGLTVGDTIDFHDSLYSASWKIIGIASDYNGIGQNSFGVILAPIAQVNGFHHLPANSSQIVMIRSKSSNQAEIDALAQRVDAALSAANLLPNEETAQQEILQNETRYNVLYALLYTVTIVIALVRTIGLFNALAMSVTERQREIGILRAMGAVARNIVQVFWTEAMTLSVLA